MSCDRIVFGIGNGLDYGPSTGGSNVKYRTSSIETNPRIWIRKKFDQNYPLIAGSGFKFIVDIKNLLPEPINNGHAQERLLCMALLGAQVSVQ